MMAVEEYKTTKRDQPSFADLCKHLDKYGPEGVFESAAHLSEGEIETLRQEAHKNWRLQSKNRWRRVER